MSKINLKICGITNKASILKAYQNNVKSLGFASNNLNGPNTINDKNIKKLIKECDYYKIESVLLTRFYSIDEIIKQIDFTKPKTISCFLKLPTISLIQFLLVGKQSASVSKT